MLAGLSCAFLGGCRPPRFFAPPALSVLGPNAVVLALGDSLTAGTGGGGVSYPAVLAELVGRRVVNAGVPGETSAEAARRAAAVVARHRPQLTILCTGGNDFLRRVSSDETRANIAAIVETVRQAGVELVLVAVPRVAPLPLNHPVYADIARAYDLWMEDDVLKSVLHNAALKSDQVHPNAAGYRRIAMAVAALLRRAGAVV